LKVCVAYQLDGRHIEPYPASLGDLARCEPKYETLPGWKTDLSACSSPSELPEAARAYVRRIGEVVGVPVATVSFGPGRGQTLPLG
jgi:adenylosuccinate synthase